MQKLIGLLSMALAFAQTPMRTANAQASDSVYTAAECPDCAKWNAPTPGVRLFGNTYYVGTRGLSSILITSTGGHVLIDGGLPQSAAHIIANIRALGFRVEDIKLIVNSHTHYDHAGGIGKIQRMSGATVAASSPAATALNAGKVTADDPQSAIALRFPRVNKISIIPDGRTIRVGSTEITARFTPGHTPGGTSWTWRSCEGTDCRDFVYADSQTPVSADGFLFTRSKTSGLGQFERSFAVIEQLKCDVLLTPHPDASRLWQRLEARKKGAKDALREADACKTYAANARKTLVERVAKELTAK